MIRCYLHKHEVEIANCFGCVDQASSPVHAAHEESGKHKDVWDFNQDSSKGKRHPSIEARCIFSSKVKTLHHKLGLGKNDLLHYVLVSGLWHISSIHTSMLAMMKLLNKVKRRFCMSIEEYVIFQKVKPLSNAMNMIVIKRPIL